jgi:hypothetical protein
MAIAVSVLLLLTSYTCAAITFGQVDTFQDGTVMNWHADPSSSNPPSNIPTGGPGVNPGDAFMASIASGGSGPGSSVVIVNTQRWTGNYAAAGVNRITAYLINLGPTTLQMRIALRGGPNGTEFASTISAALAPNDQWTLVIFDLSAESLTNVGGVDSLDAVLANVTEVRILSSALPSFVGDPINGGVGVDNITGVDLAGAKLRITDFRFTSGMPSVTFTTLAGRTHRVEKSSTLSSTSWQPITSGSDVSGTGGLVQVADTEPGAASQTRRFYRVELLQP